jgi:hypothetical protein
MKHTAFLQYGDDPSRQCSRSNAVAPLVRAAGIVTLSLLSAACGSDDGGTPVREGEPQETADELRCKTLPNTGYRGDESCLEPPAPGKGFQLHYGPKNYDDEAEVAKYLLGPGEETTDCLFMKTPNETEVFMDEYHARMRPGSHHMITYTQDEVKPDSTSPEECNFGLWRFLVGSQEESIDIRNKDQAPELEGSAMRIAPKLQAAVQLHYVNTSKTETVLREAWINAVYTDPSNVQTHVEPIFWIGGLTNVIKAHTSQVVKGQCVVGPTMKDADDKDVPTPSDLRMLQLTGHFHSHTTRFSAWKVDGATGERIRIYEASSYQEPGFTYFNTKTKNPPPEGNPFGGDYNGQLFMKIGDRIEWECNVVNDDNFDLRFGNKVYEAEMCNMFGTYAPSSGNAWNCINL